MEIKYYRPPTSLIETMLEGTHSETVILKLKRHETDLRIRITADVYRLLSQVLT